MKRHTALYQQHVKQHAKMVDFHDWQMPLHYGSQLHEHQAVRQRVGMFDVSHMLAIDVIGTQATAFLQRLLANDVAKLKQAGRSLYSCMLNPQGGIIDDLLVYFLADDYYRLVVNASRAAIDLAWLQQNADAYAIELTAIDDLAIIALQGPQALATFKQIANPQQQLAVTALTTSFSVCRSDNWVIARTGYTGEDGFEIMLPAIDAVNLWQTLSNAGVQACGLGARDSLRLEAGMALYDNDMDDSISPLESGLAWTVAWQPSQRQFIGRQALEKQQQQGLKQQLVGLVLNQRGVLRAQQTVILNDQRHGVITSGGFSPSMQQSIALARLPISNDTHVNVIIRNKTLAAKIVKPPFIRHGKIMIDGEKN